MHVHMNVHAHTYTTHKHASMHMHTHTHTQTATYMHTTSLLPNVNVITQRMFCGAKLASTLIHANHNNKLNQSQQQTQGKKTLINKDIKNPINIKAAHITS